MFKVYSVIPDSTDSFTYETAVFQDAVRICVLRRYNQTAWRTVIHDSFGEIPESEIERTIPELLENTVRLISAIGAYTTSIDSSGARYERI